MDCLLPITTKKGDELSVSGENEVQDNFSFGYEPQADVVIQDPHQTEMDCPVVSPSTKSHVPNGSFVSTPKGALSINPSVFRDDLSRNLEGDLSPLLKLSESQLFNKISELRALRRKNSKQLREEKKEQIVANDSGLDVRLIENFMNSFSFGRKLLSDIKDNNVLAYRRDPSTNKSCSETYFNLAIPYTESCISIKDLDRDSPSLLETWNALRSANMFQYLLKALRVMIFSVLPCFLLVHLPSTRDWFTAGPLVPTVAAALISDNVAEQMKLTLMIIQVSAFLVVVGVTVTFTNLEIYPVAWWFTVLMVPFFIGILFNFQAKRMTMVYVIMMMEFSLQSTSKSSTFAVFFSLDLIIASLFALLSALLPYPIFAYRLADQQMDKVHHIYADTLSKIVKSFCSPVLLEAEVARKQISWVELRQERKVLDQLIQSVPYELAEFGLKNVFRQRRLQHLGKIRWGLYSLAASSALHNEFRKELLLVVENDVVKSVQKRLSTLAISLTEEANVVLIAVGTSIYPKEVRKIDFSRLADLCSAMENLIDSERDSTLLGKPLSANQTNSLLRLFAFYTTLLTSISELLHIESWAVNFDPKPYPTAWKRLKLLLLGDYNSNFGRDLLSRVLLSTPEDARVVKDSVRYTLGLFVAVAFAHWHSSSMTNNYFYGMGILSRLAQQTASETLQIGIMRIAGLALGASFSHFISSFSLGLWFTMLLIFLFGLICVTVSNHPSYGHVGQYALMVSVAVIPTTGAISSEYVLNRIAANCFAFTAYLAVCLAVFPLDPIYVVSNYYSKVVRALNEMTHLLVALGCCPIAEGRGAGTFLLERAKALLLVQQKQLAEVSQWNITAGAEPTLRGIPYPMSTFTNLFLHFAELTSLQEGILESMESLHRHRLEAPNLVIYGMLELIRPFLIDVAKITQCFFQYCIDASEKPFEWSITKAVGELWKAKLSIISLQKVTGHIQRSFITAVLPHRQSTDAQKNGTYYVPAEKIEEDTLQDSFANQSFQESFSSTMESFMVKLRKSAVDRVDFCVFEKIVVNFILLVSTMSNCLDFIVVVHKFELSRMHPSQAPSQTDVEEKKKK